MRASSGSRSSGRYGELCGWAVTVAEELTTIAERHGATEVRYFGDIDVSGIRIPALAAAVAHEHGLPPVRPAKRLCDVLLALGRPAPSRETWSAERAVSPLVVDAPHPPRR